MEQTMWHQRWDENRIGFHQDGVHRDLMNYHDRFLRGANRILVPLCGKSNDLAYLAGELGIETVGVELVERAVRAFHDEHGIEAEIEAAGDGNKIYRSRNLSVIVGDIFSVTAERYGTFDRIWDRAALVALDREGRKRYTRHLRTLVADEAILLQNLVEYDQSVMEGPPWSVTREELDEHYGDLEIEELRREDIIERARWKERGHKTWISSCYRIPLS